MQRYSIVHNKFPREVLLLKSYPCLYGKCSFCNYIEDNSTDLAEIEAVNYTVIEQITGQYQTVEIINSGSVFELPAPILARIKNKITQANVQTLYFETYYGYRKRLSEIHKYFSEQQVRFRIGIETFDDDFRARVLNKPFSTQNLGELSKLFDACCLLVCVTGQTKAQILSDLDIAIQNFNAVTVNVFVNNATVVTRDQHLVDWFIQDVYPQIKDHPKLEILIDNRDLGVYVQ